MTRSWYPITNAHTPAPLPVIRAPKSQVYVCVCTRILYYVPSCGNYWRQIDPFTSETSFSGLVLSLINGFWPKYQHFHRPRLTRPFHRLSTTMPCLLAGRQRLLRWTRGSWREDCIGLIDEGMMKCLFASARFLDHWSRCPAKTSVNQEENQIALTFL